MLLVPHLMTCAVTPTRSDLVSMTTDAPLKAAAPEFVWLCMRVSVHTHVYTIYMSEHVHPFECTYQYAAHASPHRLCVWKLTTKGVSSTCVCARVCVCQCVLPHNEARSSIFNAAETTVSTQSEPGEACLPPQTSLPCQQEAELGDTVWEGRKHGLTPQDTETTNNIQGISFNTGATSPLHADVLELNLTLSPYDISHSPSVALSEKCHKSPLFLDFFFSTNTSARKEEKTN